MQYSVVVSGKVGPHIFRCNTLLRVGSSTEESCVLSDVSGKIILVPFTR